MTSRRSWSALARTACGLLVLMGTAQAANIPIMVTYDAITSSATFGTCTQTVNGTTGVFVDPVPPDYTISYKGQVKTVTVPTPTPASVEVRFAGTNPFYIYTAAAGSSAMTPPAQGKAGDAYYYTVVSVDGNVCKNSHSMGIIMR